MRWDGWEANKNMVTVFLFGLISLVWTIVGVAMLAGPAWWSNQVRRRMTEPLIQFLFMQGILLGGLILFVGSSPQGSWLWTFVGAIFVALALGLLGMPVSMRGRLLDRWSRSPLWANRLTGMTLVILAALLVLDTWRGGP